MSTKGHAELVGSEKVARATGRTREAWHELLDAAGATGWTHREIAAWLVTGHGVDGWWAQGLTVGYEQARGMRVPGQRPDGTFEGTSGLADGEIGQQAAASIYSLHFGDFGGLPVKIAYIVFGLALTVVSATGVYIWLGKRRRRGIAEPGLLGAWHGVVWGAPAALVATLLARFAVGNEAPFAAIFWILLAVALLAGAFSGRKMAAPQLVAQPAE